MAARQAQDLASVLFGPAGHTCPKPFSSAQSIQRFLTYANETGASRRPLVSFGGDRRWRFFRMLILVLAVAKASQEVVQAVHLEEDDRRDEQRQKL